MYSEKEFKKFIKYLNKRFKYDTDENQYGYKELWAELDETFIGDCEDYALTIKKKFGGSLYFVEMIGGGGHCVLQLPCGRYIDNIQKRRVSKKYMEVRGYMFQYKYNCVLFYYKIISGQFKLLINKYFA